LAGVRAATNFISGPVTTNTTWSGTNLLRGTVTIQSNVIVTVDPGTYLLMNTAAVLRVEGQLLADGTSNAPITFTRSTTSTNWGRLLFIRAAPSRLRHCVIEFANSVGDHQDYYPTDCATGSGVTVRPYHEAVVALASHLDIEACTFRNLPFVPTSNLNTGTGDALAIIADDPLTPGPASANVRNSRFVSIGQAVHTRFASLLVEHCHFADKRGDNDDIDLYGESTPPPVIRYNTFLAGHEDKINPTRCSAIIHNNFISGGDDHGVVLRDKCHPVVFNNIFSNFTAAAISVQNQCDALIANNTIINSGRGIRMFDHTARHGPPYCLFPGNGKATVINCILWNTPLGAVTIEASTFQPHPVVTVIHCDIQGGRNSIVTNNANCLVQWGDGNLALDPQFTNGQHLRASSPCIDTGTNALLLMSSNGTARIIDDLDGLPRPLDGNGINGAAFDMGAYEYLLDAADSNTDGIPDGWTWSHRLDPTDPGVAADNPDADAHTTYQEWVADTNPTNALSYFRVAISNVAPATVHFLSSSNRHYTLTVATNLVGQGSGTLWTDIPGQVNVPGRGGADSLTDTNPPLSQQFYRVRVSVP